MTATIDSLPLWVNAAIAATLSVAVAAVGMKAGALDASGAIAAAIVGTLSLGIGGPAAGAALLAFFLTGSALSRLPLRGATALSDFGAKGGRRDAQQVLANGGVCAACATASGLLGALHSPLHVAWLAGAVAAIAAASGDTWATELGSRLGARPRLITTWRSAPAGESGAVTVLGSLASVAGGALVGACAVPFAGGLPAQRWVELGALAGFLGSLVDSLLGASLQAAFRCPACGRRCEVAVHHAESARLERGLPWMDNDVVNFVATALTAAAAVILFM